jgi:alkyldihydroxyacetonephosphate synthase
MTLERRRSFWAWGWEDSFFDEAARANLAQMVGGLLQIEPPSLAALPVIEDARVNPPRIAIPAGLAAFCDASDRARIEHTYGRAFPDLVRGFEGDFTAAPDFVALARHEADIAALLGWAEEARVAVVPYGGGTSVVGGVECHPSAKYTGVVSLDLRAMDLVLEVDRTSLAARIQAGATGPVLEAQLAEHGLTLRHYPQSFEFSTLGGWIATRAGGHFATLYTHIDDKVESVRMITPAGAYESRRLPGSGAGPSPDRLVLGSEGALGVITEAWVRVHPRPTWRASASALFDEWGQAVEAARRVAQAGIFPANCRLLDAREAMLNGVPTGGRHVLLLGFESADGPRDPWMARAISCCRDAGASEIEGPVVRSLETDAARDRDGAAWRSSFLRGPYLQSALVSMGMIADTFETACTWDAFDALFAAVTAAVRDAMKRACGGGVISCRFTHVYPDGPAPYFTFIAPGRRGALLEPWSEIKRAASEALLANGGTITHHHAVGRTHRPWYDRQRPELFARALGAVKGTLDPTWVMNPGVLIDESDG